ncbi:hypothetical protein BU23DRAFT_492938, partial [Bimuria novae-zelandiae CBS 107.79]
YRSITSDQIRLLVLHAGKPDEVIRCSLKPILANSLEESQLGYHALSYAWGEEVLKKIHVSDLPAISHTPYPPLSGGVPRELHIRGNLYAALKRLRCIDEDVWFWIDTICIDQNNMLEKSYQLPKMLDIYQNAYSVCIWLGETEIGRYLVNTHKDPLDFVSVIVNLKLLDHIIGDPATGTQEVLESFVAFANLLKRPWFRRRWVIQEVAASKRAFVQCGQSKVNWIDFADAIQLFLDNIERIRAMYERSELSRRDPDAFAHVASVGAGALVRASSDVLKKLDECKIVARLHTIESLVVTFLHFEATESRDTIYALLPLADDKDTYLGARTPLGLQEQPYEKSTAEVYAKFLHDSVKSSNSLDIICRHWALPLNNPSSPALPSWVGLVTDSAFGPSQRAAGRLNGESLVGKPGCKIYNASRETDPSIRLQIPSTHQSFHFQPPRSPVLLVATGFRLCRITQVLFRVVDGVISHDCLEIAGWDRRHDINEIPDRLWRTLVADRTKTGSTALSWWRRACMYCLSKAASPNGDLNTPIALLS